MTSRFPFRLIIACVLLTVTMEASEGVILLHGLCRTSRSMSKLEAQLTAAGYTVVNVDYPSRTASVEKLSDDAIGAALDSEKLQDCSRINFVTHSLGGILVRSYFRRHAPGKLGRVVMLGPPNQGSEVVDRLGGWKLFQKINGPAGAELGTDAGSTPNQLGPVEFELGVIAGDRSINWINSLLLPGADDGKVSVQRTKVTGMKELLVVPVSHPFLMRDKNVIRRAIHFLQHGEFGSNS